MQTSPQMVARAQRLVALSEFRSGFYRCLTGWGDALFELTDALLCAPGAVGSVPSLSLEPIFRRSHGSLYKGLARGEVDADAMRQLLVESQPCDWPLVFAVDASVWERSDAETSPERGFYHSASRQSAGQPIVAGWSYQWIAQLSWAPDSWTAPVDVTRIRPSDDATALSIDQVRRLVGRLPGDAAVPMAVFDAGYDAIAISHGLAEDRVQVLARIRGDRVFYADPLPLRGGERGRPRRHGRRFKCSDRRTQRSPDATLMATDPRYGTVSVAAWHDLHPRLARRGAWRDEKAAPIVKGTVIRVEVEHLPKPAARAKKTLWLWWSGPGEPDLDLCWRAYLRRFDLEHTYRFVKNTMGWTAPSLRTPEQADRWTWLIVAGYTQLRLARTLVDDMRLPWERNRAPDKLTPARVRRAFSRLGALIDTPASPPQSDKPGPGRPKGTCRPPRTRYPVVKKAA
ncbi:MAG TPA: NF041680 family putative transposase [Acidimicrobiales bacterium]|nr:NF041680 family putative transposase [Acidimicrobiales bacterium]